MLESSNSILSFKEEMLNDDFAIEYEILPAYDADNFKDTRRKRVVDSIAALDAKSDELSEIISKLNSDIDRLTNHADGLDYSIAVGCGVLCGLIDSLVIGEFDFKSAKAKSNKEINNKVLAFAKKKGYKGERLDGAVSFLENKYKLPGDGTYKEYINPLTGKLDAITNKSHHLDDFCHHPTLVGLCCCVFVQFTKETIYVDKNSNVLNIPITVNDYGQFQGKNTVTKLFSGIINWFFTVAKTMANAKGHWMSDLAGSSSSKKDGAGLPGSLMSLLKELSALPVFQDTNFAENLRKAYQNGIGTGKSQVDLKVFNSLFSGASSKFDYRTENAIKGELKRQAFPIVINEVLVRSFYFIRRFISEVKERKTISEIDWRNVLPVSNRTIERMLTISTGTFTAIDLADAAIRSAIEVGPPVTPAFWSKFVLKVNFVGVGRFAIAVGIDVGMGVKRQSLIKERMIARSEDISLQVAKVYYLQQGMWIEAVDTENAIRKMCAAAEQSAICFVDSWGRITESIENIGDSVADAEGKNPGLTDEIKYVLEWS